MISTNAYEPKRSTSVWNFKIPSTSMTKSANQQIPNMAANLILRFFSFIMSYCLLRSNNVMCPTPFPDSALFCKDNYFPKDRPAAKVG